MQVRVPFLAVLAALASVPALALAQPMSSASTGGDCFRRAPSGDVWQAAPCSGQASADFFQDGLAGGPPSKAILAPPAYTPPAYTPPSYTPPSYAPPSYAPPSLTYQADAGARYEPAPLSSPPPSYDRYPEPPPLNAPGPSYASAGYASADSAGPCDAAPSYASSGYATQAYDAPADIPPPPQATYEPNRAPFYAGNIVSAPTPLLLPAPPVDQVYAAPIDVGPAYAQAAPPVSYGPPPLPAYGYGPNDCAYTGGPLGGGGAWERQDCRTAASAGATYAAPGYVAPAYAPPAPDYHGGGYAMGQTSSYGGSAYSASSSSTYSQQQAGGYQVSNGGYIYAAPPMAHAPAPVPLSDYRGGSANGSYAYGGSSSGYSQQQAGGYQGGSGGGYAYASPSVLPGYAPGQCASSSGVIAGGRAQYDAQTCERSSSQAYSYSSSASGGYAGPGAPIVGDLPHWGVAGRDANGFLTWAGKVGN